MSITIVRASSVTGPVMSGQAPDWFDPRSYLGRRGTAVLPRAVQMSASAVAASQIGDDLAAVDETRRGLWSSTSSFAERTHDEMDEVLRSGSAETLSPARAPYFSVNLLGSRIAQDYRIKGHVVTLTTPTTGFIDACAAASAALNARLVHAGLVVCTDVGQPSPEGSVALLLRGSGAGSPILGWARGFLDPFSPGEEGTQRFTDQMLALMKDDPEKITVSLHGSLPIAMTSFLDEQIGSHSDVTDTSRRLLPQALAVAEAVQAGRPQLLLTASTGGAWAALRLGRARQ